MEEEEGGGIERDFWVEEKGNEMEGNREREESEWERAREKEWGSKRRDVGVLEEEGEAKGVGRWIFEAWQTTI